MAKKANSFSNYGWSFKRGEVESKYIKVTPENRQMAVKYGRILYIIEGNVYRGYFTIDPRFTKGWLRYPFMPWEVKNNITHWRVFIHEDIDMENWKEGFRAFIDHFLNKGFLYVNPSDPLLTYHKEQ